MSPPLKVMISCGEASGDLYAGALARDLRTLDPDLTMFGFGGDQLARAGAELIDDYRHHHVTGLAEVLAQLPRTYALYRRLVSAARARRPDVLVLIDFPDFNFRLGGALRRLGVPVVYYISPQLWAWRSGRLKTMKQFVDLVLPIFPFEEALYKDAGIPVEFVGHPLVDLARPTQDRAAFLASVGLKPDAPTVALLPGSRPNELREILPDLVSAARLVATQVPDVQFLLARAPHLSDALLAPAITAAVAGGAGAAADSTATGSAHEGAAPDHPPLRLAIIEGRADDVLASADIVITASGTATVQTALHGKPMVIVYRLSKFTYRLGRRFVKIDTFGMVNLIAGRRIVPELIQDDFSPESASHEVVRLLLDEPHRARVIADVEDVRRKLGGTGASRRAAAAVLRLARQKAMVS
jgi:lipid-A-disaccharide synthase